MKKQRFLALFLFLSVAELAVLFFFVRQPVTDRQDTIRINEVLHRIQENWEKLAILEIPEILDVLDAPDTLDTQNISSLEYTILDEEGNVRIQTSPEISSSVHQAILHRDTILPIQKNGQTVGTLLVFNDSGKQLKAQKQTAAALLAVLLLLQAGVGIGYFFLIDKRILKPFGRLKGFAERIAGGNLDVPLEMDRDNVFGAFTESFDIMRAELKRARQAEWEANQSKKELVAKLSHDIRTPVASIKAVSEVGAALAGEGRQKETYQQIIQKADQINTLVSNLFTATLEELQRLSVQPEDINSEGLREMLEQADYLHRAVIPEIPACMIYADRLRLQQVFDNLLANSYKYADTAVLVEIFREERYLVVAVEDRGGGVRQEELPLLKQKYIRGKNAQGLEGAGLGLFLADYFMKGMSGELSVENGEEGLRVMVRLLLSGIEGRRLC